MKTFVLRQLLYLDAHIGDRSNHPSMNQYIYGIRNKSMIIDLEKTVMHLRSALKFVEEVSRSGGYILFVVDDHNRYYERGITSLKHTMLSPWSWVSGILTNFMKRFIVPLKGIPDIVIYLGKDSHLRKSIVRETSHLRIPCISLVDTNDSSLGITYPIPSNDDSKELTYLYLDLFLNAVKLGNTTQLL